MKVLILLNSNENCTVLIRYCLVEKENLQSFAQATEIWRKNNYGHVYPSKVDLVLAYRCFRFS